IRTSSCSNVSGNFAGTRPPMTPPTSRSPSFCQRPSSRPTLGSPGLPEYGRAWKWCKKQVVDAAGRASHQGPAPPALSRGDAAYYKHPVADAILVLNAGSSSLKFEVFADDGVTLARRVAGGIEEL